MASFTESSDSSNYSDAQSDFSDSSLESNISLIINEYNEDDSSSGNSENDNEEFGVQPYQFEPLVNEPQLVENQDAMEMENPRLNNTDWCNCGHCFVMPTPEESFCCRDEVVNQRLIDVIGDYNCIINTETFNDIMNRNILNILFDEFREYNFVPVQDEINPTYRYLIYRLYTRWIFRVLGRRVRRPIPSCAVARIRREYPSDNYQGFMEPGPH